MLTVVPLTVVLLGVLGLAVMVASALRMFVLEAQVEAPRFLVDPGPQERPRIAA
jgi:hypothetical protein